MTLKYLYLIIVISFFNCIQAMEDKNRAISIIVDCNNHQSLSNALESIPPVIGVFGGTVRYSAFLDYKNSLDTSYDALCGQYNKNKRLKGISSSIKKNIVSLAADPGLENIKQLITTLPEKENFRLFFATGFEQDTLQENVSVLFKTVRKYEADSNEKVLVHCLLPSYFADISTSHDKPHATETIHSFLLETASFFKTLYQQVISEDALKIFIVIPPIDHFMRLIHSGKVLSNAEGNPPELLERNCDALYDTLLEPLHGQKFLFFDQDAHDSEPMLNYLECKGIKKETISCTRIPITNQMGFPSTIFLPYILKRGKKYSYQTSPLFTDVLEKYLREKTKGVSHE